MRALIFLTLLCFPVSAFAQGQPCPIDGTGVNLGRLKAEQMPYNVINGKDEVLPQDHWVDKPDRERCVLFGCETLTEVGKGVKWNVLEVTQSGDCGYPARELVNQCRTGDHIAVSPETLTVAQDAATKRCADAQTQTPAAREARKQQEKADALRDLRSFPAKATPEQK